MTRFNTPLVAALTLAAAACGQRAEGRGAPPETVIPVQMVPVVPAGQAAIINASGTLGAKDEVVLAFKIGGVIAKVNVDDGARVKRGQTLAALDLREIDAMLTKATVGAEKARRDAARVERLYRDSVATLAQMQDAQSARDAAEADLKAARVNHEYATIVAPGNGVVMSRLANAGQTVGPGTPVMMFGSRTRGSVLRAGLADRDAVQVRVGDAAEVSFEAVPGKVFKGKVANVGGAADPRTGLIVVEIALTGVDALPTGLVGRAAIATSGPNRTLFAVPAEALVEGDKEHGTLYTVDAAGKRAQRVRVTLVGLSGSQVLVRGLDGVSRVVRSGATWLTDSARVEIKP